MTDEARGDHADFDPRVARAIREHASSVDPAIDPRAFVDAARAPSAMRRPVIALGLVLIVGAIAVVAQLPRTGEPGATDGVAAAATCTAFGALEDACRAAQGSASFGPARIDRARIWLTTLASVKERMDPPQQVVEPPRATPVWVFVYDGSWSCCLVGNPDGSLTPPSESTRWLHVVDATSVPDGSFVYLHDSSGRPVPDRLPVATLEGAVKLPAIAY